MSALSTARQATTFASRPYLENLFGEQQRVPKSAPTDPALREFMLEVGERVRGAREQKGWRREDLAQAMGLGFKSIQNYEQGRVTLNKVSQLGEVLGVDPRWLLHGERALLESLEDVRGLVLELRDSLVGESSASGPT